MALLKKPQVNPRLPPESDLLTRLLRGNHLTSIPDNWAIDRSGNIHVIQGPEDVDAGGFANPHAPAPGGALRDPHGTYDMGFGGQLLHALPYLGAAVGMGFAGAALAPGAAAGSGSAGAASAAGGVLPSTTIGAGYAPAIAGSTGLGAGSTGGGVGLGSVISKAASVFGKGNKYLDLASNVGDALSNFAPDASALAQGRADARVTQGAMNQRQDAATLDRYRAGLDAANTDLNQRKYALTAPGTRMGQSVRGDVLANAQDFHWGAPTMVGNIPVPSSTGGLRPSIFSDATRSLGGLVSKQMLADQTKGDTFAPLGTPPGVTPLPEAGALDSALTTAGTAGSLYHGFADFLKKYRQGAPTQASAGGDASSGWGDS